MYSLILVVLATFMEPAPTSRPATTMPTTQPVIFVLGGPQKDGALVNWVPQEGGDAIAKLVRETPIVIQFPDGRTFALPAYNFCADASAGRLWHVEVRPAWPRTTQRNLADQLRAQFTEWKIPLGEKQKQFLAEMDRVGAEPPNGWNTIQGCVFEWTEQTSIAIRLDGTKASAGKNNGGWFVVFDFALHKRPKSVEPPKRAPPPSAPKGGTQ